MEGAATPMANGTLFLVSTPIGNLADLSRRALETLGAVTAVYAEDTRHTAKLLRHYGLKTPLRSLHEHNEVSRIEEVLGRLATGADLALVSDAGTPVVSDPGSRLVAAAMECGIRVEPIPGPSAVTAALSASGLEADRFLFLGFAPRRGRDREQWMSDAVESRHTVVAFESPNRLLSLLREWEERGAGARLCAVCRELTKLHEEVRRGTVSRLAEYYSGGDVRGEVTVVLEPGRSDQDSEAGGAAAERRAVEMAGSGLSAREIANRLQAECGLTRNRAYALALRVSGKE